MISSKLNTHSCLKSSKPYCLLIVCVLLTGLSNRQAEGATRLYYLGNLPGGQDAVPRAINDSGVVGGSGWPASGNYTAILFGVLTGGTNVDLNYMGGWSEVRGISNSGQIVGSEAGDPTGAGRALLFDASGNGNNVDLGTGKWAYAINNNSLVVGASGGHGGEPSSAWLRDLAVGTAPTFLGEGSATAISDSGFIVGSSHPEPGDSLKLHAHATLFDATGGGDNIDLGKLSANDDRSFAHGANNAGQIVGISGGPYVGYTATLFDITGSGQNIALGALGNSYANAINNLGQVVGEENGHAALLDVTGNRNNIDLNDLIDPASGWVLLSATGINNLGWIIGAGNRGAFLLAPDDAFPAYVVPPYPPQVPEPGSWSIAVVLFLSVALADRRQRQ